jgi:hypothetical protein
MPFSVSTGLICRIARRPLRNETGSICKTLSMTERLNRASSPINVGVVRTDMCRTRLSIAYMTAVVSMDGPNV